MNRLGVFFPFGLLVSLNLLAADVLHTDCFQQAAERYYLPIDLIYAIADVESGLNQQSKRANNNGSYDIGIMQINDQTWSRKLLKDYNISPGDLEVDVCTNVMVGSWILMRYIARYGLVNGIAAYNVGPGGLRSKPSARHRYVKSVLTRWEQRISQQTKKEHDRRKLYTQPQF